MAVLAVDEVWRVRVFCSDSEQLAINTFHYRVSAVAGSGCSPGQFAADFSAAVHAGFKSVMTSSATFKGVGVQRMDPIPVRSEQYDSSNSGAGTGGAVGLPRQTSGLVTWRDLRYGRRNHGRTYFPFPAASHNDLVGIPKAAYLTDLDTLALAITALATVGAGGDTASLIHVLYHRAIALPVAVAAFTTDVQTYVVRDQWAGQKRRGSYGRPNVSPV